MLLLIFFYVFTVIAIKKIQILIIDISSLQSIITA